MGIDPVSLLMLTLVGAQASQTMRAGQQQAKAIVREGELRGKEKAKEIRHKVARQTVSFLDAGISLEGTPEAVISETFKTGQEDIAEIGRGANIRAKSAIGAARSKAIGKIASGFMGAQLGSMFSTAVPQAASFLPEQALFKANELGFGSTAFEALEFKDLRG